MPLVRHQHRRDTAAAWVSANPVLLAGEPALEIDTGRTKVGDGVRNWNSLPYTHVAGLATTAPPAIGTASAGTGTLAARSDHTHALPSSLSTTTIAASGNVTVGGDLSVSGTLTAAAASIPAASITGLSEAVDDRVSALVVAGTGITKTYDDAANTLTLAVGSHTQAISTVTGLQAALDGKASATHTHTASDISGLPTSTVPSAHRSTHATGGTDALTPTDIGAASATHTHSISSVTGLQTALDSKQPTGSYATSSATGITGATAIGNIVFMTQAAYDALASKNSTTIYVIS